MTLALLAMPASAQAPGRVPRPWGLPWAAVPGPLAGPPHIFGGASAGCLTGAESLPAEGPGWQVVRLSRNCHWGHPALLDAIRGLAAQARQHGLATLWIGDMSQPRGGPLPWGHASHQVGLDVDVWLDLNPKPPSTPAQRENIEVASLVTPDGMAVDRARWREAHAQLVRLAAEMPGADRVFVNPAIKQELCRAHAGESWLRRVRPWWGHDEHLHLRLRCPQGLTACEDQAPPPPGDGCDASLAWWFTEEARRPPPRPSRPPSPPHLPRACAAVLNGSYR
jgi:penicillin-insensitive murein DD-endopeptidase